MIIGCAICDDGEYWLLVARNEQDEIVAVEIIDEYYHESFDMAGAHADVAWCFCIRPVKKPLRILDKCVV